MSWEASGWAKKQKTGSPAAKALLLVIADYWNPQNHCIASQEALAEESEQSVDSVQLQLFVLQEKCLIARERRPKLGGSGGRTSDKIVLLMPGVEYRPGPRTIPLGPVPFKLAKARSRRRNNPAEVKPQHAVLGTDAVLGTVAALGTVSALPQEQFRHTSAAPVPVCEVPERHEPLREPTREPTPPLTPPAPAALEAGLPANGRPTEQSPSFAEFWEHYRPDESMSRSEAEREWQKLDVEGQRKALAAIGSYFLDCQSKDRKRRAAVNYLRGRTFDGFAQGPDIESARIAHKEFVEEDTPEWKAWQRHLQARGKVGSPVTHYLAGGRTGLGWWFPTRWPPGWSVDGSSTATSKHSAVAADAGSIATSKQSEQASNSLQQHGSAVAAASECDQHFERVDAGAREMAVYVAHIRETQGERSAASVEFLGARQGFVMVPNRWLSIARKAIEQSGTADAGS